MKNLFIFFALFSFIYANIGIEGNYIGVNGCQDSHGFGMYENGMKIVKLKDKYYAVLFDMKCHKYGTPKLITDTSFYAGGAVHIWIKPLKIENNTFKIGNDIYKLKDGYIIQQLPQDYLQKVRKYLREMKAKKKKLTKEQFEAMKEIENQIAPGGYKRYKRINKDNSGLYKDIMTYAMYNAIYKKDKNLINRLMYNKYTNRCVDVYTYDMTPYEYSLKNVFTDIVKIFKKHGVTGTCKKVQDSSLKLEAIDKQVLNVVKQTLHYVKDKNIKAFSRITDSGRIINKKQIQQLIKSGAFKWDNEFRYIKYLTHEDIDKIQIYKIAKKDKERKCRIMGTNKVFPCKSLEYCFKIEGKPYLPDDGCTNMYYISGRIYMEPFGW